MGWIVLGVIVGAVMILLSKRNRERPDDRADDAVAVPDIGGDVGDSGGAEGGDGGSDGGDGGE